MKDRYQNIDDKGRLKSYYGIGQKWEYTDVRGRVHTVEVKHFLCNKKGIQYFWISLDDKFQEKPLSAARLHYFLHEKQAVELKNGAYQPILTLLIDEVRLYFEHAVERPDCPYCGGTGIDDDNKVCSCAEEYSQEIRKFNAERRLAALLKV